MTSQENLFVVTIKSYAMLGYVLQHIDGKYVAVKVTSDKPTMAENIHYLLEQNYDLIYNHPVEAAEALEYVREKEKFLSNAVLEILSTVANKMVTSSQQPESTSSIEESPMIPE